MKLEVIHAAIALQITMEMERLGAALSAIHHAEMEEFALNQTNVHVQEIGLEILAKNM